MRSLCGAPPPEATISISGIVWGSRTALITGLVTVLATALIGGLIGGVGAYRGGLADDISMRVVDLFMSIPFLIAVIVMTTILGKGLEKIIVALIVFGWHRYARMMRSEVLEIKEQEYVLAARNMGASPAWIFRRHIIPNAVFSILILMSINIGRMVLVAAALSFVGVGAEPGFADWGQMLNFARSWIAGTPGRPFHYWYTYTYAAIAITTFVLGWTLLGDALRDVLGGARRHDQHPSSGEPALCQGFIHHLSEQRQTGAGGQESGPDGEKGRGRGLVGESGSGKSVTAMTIAGLLRSSPKVQVRGRVVFNGLRPAIVAAGHPQPSRKVTMIFQDPFDSLNPAFTVGYQIQEVFRVQKGFKKREAWLRAVEMLGKVRIPSPASVATHYPHQLSGGMCQRVMIAMALAAEPELLIADEPTTALDVTIQAQILQLLYTLYRDTGTAILFITHDLGVVAQFCHSVAIMLEGEIVEQGPTAAIFKHPLHPYTRACSTPFRSWAVRGACSPWPPRGPATGRRRMRVSSAVPDELRRLSYPQAPAH